LDITSTKPEAGEGDFGFTQWGPLSAGVGTPMKNECLAVLSIFCAEEEGVHLSVSDGF